MGARGRHARPQRTVCMHRVGYGYACCYTPHASPAQLVVCCLCTCVDLFLFDHLQFDYSYKIRLHLVAHLASFTTSG
jgi:hypothetical protein